MTKNGPSKKKIHEKKLAAQKLNTWDIFGVAKTKSHEASQSTMKFSNKVDCHSFEIFAPVKEFEVAKDEDNEIRESKVDYMD
jgi:hypothetical protein